jgi:hypothetical protein
MPATAEYTRIATLCWAEPIKSYLWISRFPEIPPPLEIMKGLLALMNAIKQQRH